MREQKIINFNEIIDAADVICRFCTAINSIRCKNCGVNLTVKENYNILTDEQKEKVECPWNGLESPYDMRTFEFGED